MPSCFLASECLSGGAGDSFRGIVATALCRSALAYTMTASIQRGGYRAPGLLVAMDRFTSCLFVMGHRRHLVSVRLL
jgi:hypothetical protein